MTKHGKGRDPGQGKSRPSGNSDKGEAKPRAGKRQQSLVVELDSNVREQFAGDAEFIRQHVEQARDHMLLIGNRLLAVKDKIPRGQWQPWLRSEFQWREQTARNYMNVARAVAKNST